jgi:SAF domain
MANQPTNLAAVLILLHPGDNVLVLGRSVQAGQQFSIDGIAFRFEKPLTIGHKIARRDIAQGEKISKYGVPIGSATQSIKQGQHVHVDNLKSDYTQTYTLEKEHLYGQPTH